MAMNPSLSRLPWYGQIGVFVGLALLGVGDLQLDAALLVPVPAQEPLLLKQLQVLVGRTVGGEPEALADLPVRGSDAALPAVSLDVLQDLFLALGQVGHGRQYRR